MTSQDRADDLLADLLSIIRNKLNSTLRSQMLARLRDEFDEVRQEGFREGLEMHHASDN
jgi:hypothetical protein